ncbi:MFS transporter [Burkholderia multivorans]|uniref:MFS transporter n=1 Tax=Burkholderia multivorans TaxID=87883 RepID=UPI00075C19F9|nr:MFS transporter [Burkholderia multivorans]KVV28900.1 MFS transporter [Burkholderia multivorans]MBU9206338.1 MFS transporter [Burkholderia multivorans]MCA8389747.1 MFS transporter [Burkholderia multivorans]MCO8355443.1 MFS transporter [Burkholderia multivorans]MCO8388532.1 MFS transporter [Burkholderia multivorans]
MTLSESRRNAVALAAVCVTSLMFGLEISSVPVILPTLEHVLHGDFNGMQWIMNAYTIACTTVLMAAGTLADRFGRKRVYVIGTALFGATSLLCGLAPNVPVLVAGRLLQGASGGAMLICQIAVLSHQFREGRERGRAFGIWGIVFGIGLGFGPIVGGAIVAVASWPWVFLVHAPLAAVALALIGGAVQESRDPHAGTLDVAGIVTLSLAVLGLAFYITQSAAGLGVLGATVLAVGAFVVAERRSARPMFDFSVFRIRAFTGAIFGSMGMNFSFWPFMIYLPIWFQVALGYDSVTAGLALLAYTLPTLVAPPFGERLALRYGPGVVIPGGLFTIAAGFALMRIGSAAEHASWLTMLPGCVIAGIGLGLANTPVTNTTTGAVPSARAGMASGIDMSARMISLALNIAMMGFVLVAGIVASLKGGVAAAIGDASLRALAQEIAAGRTEDLRAIAPALAQADPTGAALHAALVHGFGWVMVYGAAGVAVLATASAIAFAPARRSAAVCE